MKSSSWKLGAVCALVVAGVWWLRSQPPAPPVPERAAPEARVPDPPEPAASLEVPQAAPPLVPIASAPAPAPPRSLARAVRDGALRDHLEQEPVAEDEVEFAEQAVAASRRFGEALAEHTDPSSNEVGPTNHAPVRGAPSIPVACVPRGGTCLSGGECCLGLACYGAVSGYGVAGRCDARH